MKSKQTLVFDFSNVNSETVFGDDYEGDGILEGNIFFWYTLCASLVWKSDFRTDSIIYDFGYIIRELSENYLRVTIEKNRIDLY